MKKIFILIIFISALISSCGGEDRTGRIKELFGTAQSIECGEYQAVDETIDLGDCEEGFYCENNKCKEPCEGMECGGDHGVVCGECTGEKEFCDSSNQCRRACEGMECGTDHGVDCGECSGEKEYCDSNKCRKACEDMNCGTDHEVDCGVCETDWICGDDNVCYDPCEGKECGESEGFVCGECLNGNVCEENSCVVNPCIYEKFPNYNDGDCWSDATPGSMEHEDAISYCKGIGGRLPTISELRTLIQNCPKTEFPQKEGVTEWCEVYDPGHLSSYSRTHCYTSCSDVSVFGDTRSLWSSSVVSDLTQYKWYVDFYSGGVSYTWDTTNICRVRCIR